MVVPLWGGVLITQPARSDTPTAATASPRLAFSALSQQQAALLTKFLWVGKHCYESRNFATAMQVLCGVENPIVRQLPVGDS